MRGTPCQPTLSDQSFLGLRLPTLALAPWPMQLLQHPCPILMRKTLSRPAWESFQSAAQKSTCLMVWCRNKHFFCVEFCFCFSLIIFSRKVEETAPSDPPAREPVPPTGPNVTGPSDDRKPSVQRAKVQYAKFHNVSVGDVTQEMLVESPEGLEGWACYGLDCKARGPMGNAVYRQLKKDPGAQECYKWLFDDLEKKFRQSWAMDRSFDTVLKKRIKTISTKVKQEEIGVWKSELQLQQHFGGVDQPEAQRQASNYIKNCRKWEDWGLSFLLIFCIIC